MMVSETIDTALTRRDVGYNSKPRWRKIGTLLEAALAANRNGSALVDAVWRLSTIPTTTEILKKFAALGRETLSQEFVLIGGDENFSWVFNPVRRLPAEVRDAVIRLLNDENQQRDFLHSLIPTVPIPKDMEPIAFIGNALEATSYEKFEPLIVRAAGGDRAIGQPMEVDLNLSNGWISHKNQRRPRMVSRFRNYYRLIDEVKKRSFQTEGEVLKFLAELKSRQKNNSSELEKSAIALFFSFLEEDVKGRTRLEAASVFRYLEEVPYILFLLSRNIEEGGLLFPEQDQALRIVEAAGLFVSECSMLRVRFKRAQSRIEQNLVGLTAARRWFEFDGGVPKLEDSQRCALWIMVIILFAGRRYRCLMEISPGQFRIGENGQVDVFILSTKVKAAGKSWFQISALLPDDDLDFLIKWITSCKGTSLENRSLVGIALNLEEEKISGRRNWHTAFASALKRECGRDRMVNTHDPRRVFANWVLIRWLLEQHLCLIDHPLIKENIPPGYLSPAARERFRQVIDANKIDDALIVAAGLMGNLSTKQVRYTYCRVWPIWMALKSDLKQGRQLHAFQTPSS